MLCIALEEDEDAAVLLFEALPEKDLVNVHIFLLFTHHLEPHTLGVQVVTVCLQTSISLRKVQLVRHLLVLIHSTHLVDVGAKEAYVFDQTVTLLVIFRDCWQLFLLILFGRVDIREVLFHG